ncbi:MAG: 30S ribosomal protein S24e [Candidatus Kariarchaeaceae archaeon]|jgi:small subunit ribosomal protein S24e
MEIEILERKVNPELKREEISFKIDHDSAQTPARSVVVSKLAAMLNADKSQTILKEIKSHFGKHEAIGYANLYETEDFALEIEPKHILKRNGLLEEEDK